MGALHCEHLIEVDIDYLLHAACLGTVQRTDFPLRPPLNRLVLTYFLGKGLAEFGSWRALLSQLLGKPYPLPTALLKLIAASRATLPIFTLLAIELAAPAT